MLVTSCRPSVNKNQIAVPRSNCLSLLEKTCELLKNFPEYLDVVVSVARKTDGRHWADLFSAAGRSTEYNFSNLYDIFLYPNPPLVLSLTLSGGGDFLMNFCIEHYMYIKQNQNINISYKIRSIS